MAEFSNKTYNVAFDSRLQWNEVLGHWLEDIRLNRIQGQYQAWHRSIWGLLDMGRTFIPEEKEKLILESLEKSQRLIWRYESTMRFNDMKSQGARKKIAYEIEKTLSEAQVYVTRQMAAKGMISPLKVPLEEWNDQEIADGMGL